jgi:hypothetical protein
MRIVRLLTYVLVAIAGLYLLVVILSAIPARGPAGARMRSGGVRKRPVKSADGIRVNCVCPGFVETVLLLSHLGSNARRPAKAEFRRAADLDWCSRTSASPPSPIGNAQKSLSRARTKPRRKHIMRGVFTPPGP